MDPRLLLLSSSAALFFLFCLPTSDCAPSVALAKSSRRSGELEDYKPPPKQGYISVTIKHGPDGDDQDEMTRDAVGGGEAEAGDSDFGAGDDPLRGLRESEQFIVRQLTDTRDNEVRGIVE